MTLPPVTSNSTVPGNNREQLVTRLRMGAEFKVAIRPPVHTVREVEAEGSKEDFEKPFKKVAKEKPKPSK